MAAGARQLVATALAIGCLAGCGASGREPAPDTAASSRHTSPSRIVSLVPAVTEMLFAIGAGPSVVAVSSYDTFPPEVDALPKVGALLDPDSERILALRPDLVVVYGSQTSEEARFAAAGIPSFTYRHTNLEGVLTAIAALGARTGHSTQAARVVSDIRRHLDRIAARVAGRPRPKTLLVFNRPPGVLKGMYVSGGVGFTHDMLTIAGGDNVFAETTREAVQPSHETILTRAPEVIVEVAAEALAPGLLEQQRAAWSLLPSVPAVQHGRIVFLSGSRLVVSGPRIAEGVEAMARALHPEAFETPDGERRHP